MPPENYDYEVNNITEFMSYLDVRWAEIADALPPDTPDNVLSGINNAQRVGNGPVWDSLYDVPDEIVCYEVKSKGFGLDEWIRDTLAARSQTYDIVEENGTYYITETS